MRTEGGGGAPAAGTVSLGRRCVRLASGCCGTAGSRRLRSTICAAPALLAAAPIRRAPPCPPSPGEAAAAPAAPAAPATRTRRPPASLLLLSPPCRGVFQLLATVLSQKASAQETAVGDGPAKAQDIPAGACCRPPGCREQEEPWPCRGRAVDPGICLFFYCHGTRRQKKNVWVKNDSLAFRLLPGLLLPRLVGAPWEGGGVGGGVGGRGGRQRSSPAPSLPRPPRQPHRSPSRGPPPPPPPAHSGVGGIGGGGRLWEGAALAARPRRGGAHAAGEAHAGLGGGVCVCRWEMHTRGGCTHGGDARAAEMHTQRG